MKKIKFLCMAITLTISNAIHAQNYDCEFSSGSFGKWEEGSVTTADNIWSEGTVRLIQDPEDANKYMMTSGIGNIPMSRKDTGFGFTFLSEKLGDPMYLSVFDTSIPQSNSYIAVLSRHAMVLVFPQPSQYHGQCTPSS
jgi:hypothetical protein